MNDGLTHDILKGILNGVEFDADEGDDPLNIPPVPCEVCGRPIWLGIILSSCGDSNREVHEEWPEGEGFQQHCCDSTDYPDLPECEECFPDEEEELTFNSAILRLDEYSVAR